MSVFNCYVLPSINKVVTYQLFQMNSTLITELSLYRTNFETSQANSDSHSQHVAHNYFSQVNGEAESTVKLAKHILSTPEPDNLLHY